MQYNLSVKENDHGIRVDKFIADNIVELSRSKIKFLLENDHVTRNNSVLRNCSYRVRLDDKFEICIPNAPPVEMVANDGIKLNIVYENEAFLVVDKQAGLTVHPGAGNHDNTMANALVSYFGNNLSDVGGDMRPGIVHRLDKDTSGLLVVAKTDYAHNHLAKQITERTFKRKYQAICWGVPKPHVNTITANIGRHKNNRLKMSVVEEGGKVATTSYVVKKIFGHGVASIVECSLQTGRTHQIRVHLSHIGNPLIGDPIYGARNNKYIHRCSVRLREFLETFNRQALHSCHLGVENPITNNYIEFISELPNDLSTLVKLLDDLQ